MAPDAIIFGLANPTPEVHPEVAHRHARVVATGRSDFPNQINNVLAFPGIFRGAFDVARHRDHRGHEARRGRRARRRSSATTCAEDLVIPSPFDPRVGPAVRRGGRRGRAAGRGGATLSAPRAVLGVGSMFAVYAETFSSDDPLSGLRGRGATRSRGARRVDHRHRQGRLAQPPRPVVAARRRAEARRRCR